MLIDLDNPLSHNTAALCDVVAQQNPNDQLLFVLPSGDLGTVVERDSQFELAPYGVSGLANTFSMWATFKGTLARRNDLIKAYVESRLWDGIPTIERLGRAPAIGDDLSVTWEQGYAPRARIFVTGPMTEGELPSPEDAAAYLMSYFDSFALKYSESKADCLGLALTPYLVSHIKGPIPGAAFVAQQTEVGKTTLAELIHVMGTGRESTITAYPKPGDMQKDITSILNGAPQTCIFDNIRENLDSPVLESLLTARKVQDRTYYTQRMAEKRNNTLWMFTLNGAVASPDMQRRVIIVPLDKVHSAAKWNPNIKAQALAAYDAIAHAVVSLVENWKAQGCPLGPEMSGYQEWSRVVGGILQAAGVEGFMVRREDTKDSVYSTETGEAEILERLSVLMGDDKWTTTDLFNALTTDDRFGPVSGHEAEYHARQFVREWAGRGSTTALGKRLSKLKDRIFPDSPLMLTATKLHSKAYYSVVIVPGATMAEIAEAVAA